MGNGLFTIFKDQFFQLFADWARRSAIFAADDVADFFRNHLVTAENNVHGSHGANNLAAGRNKRRIPQVSTDFRHFLQQGIVLIGNAHLSKLFAQVAEHAAGNLEAEDLRVDVAAVWQVEGLDKVGFNLLEVIAIG